MVGRPVRCAKVSVQRSELPVSFAVKCPAAPRFVAFVPPTSWPARSTALNPAIWTVLAAITEAAELALVAAARVGRRDVHAERVAEVDLADSVALAGRARDARAARAVRCCSELHW